MRVRALLAVVAIVFAGGIARATLGGPQADLRAVPAFAADARGDLSLTDTDVARLTPLIDTAVARVETLFARRFEVRPRILLFATRESFSRGLETLFDYSEGVATAAANHYGGIFDRATATIALRLDALGGAGIAPVLDHELTHQMVRELARGRPLPVWFEEGTATLVERDVPDPARWIAQESLVGRAVAKTARASFAQTETLEGWHATYPRVGQSLYSYAAEAVSLMRARIQWSGLLELIDAVGDGATFEAAYAALTGESVAALETRLRAGDPGIISRPARGGSVEWTLFSGVPLAPSTVTIVGASTYTVTFTVTTDDIGLYRATFGSTAPPGTYLVSASGARAELTTQRP